MTPAAALRPLGGASTALLCRVNQATNLTLVLPILVLSPTSRCNSRCVSCDWWQSTGADDLTLDELECVANTLPGLGTRLVAFSGGEPLLRPDVFEIARLFRARGAALHLLTSGIALERHAAQVGALFERVTLSLDAATADHYAEVRGIDGLHAVESGVVQLRSQFPRLPITARCTLHALNYRALPAIIRKARSMALDSISFLAADVSSTAFGRHGRPPSELLRMDARQTAEFRTVIELVLRNEQDAFSAGFVTNSPERLRLLPSYYAALAGMAPFPPVTCNAPWVSTVLEANGDVRPCFFHAPVGNVRTASFTTLVRKALPEFRRDLDVARNTTCQSCVCSIKVGVRNRPWR